MRGKWNSNRILLRASSGTLNWNEGGGGQFQTGSHFIYADLSKDVAITGRYAEGLSDGYYETPLSTKIGYASYYLGLAVFLSLMTINCIKSYLGHSDRRMAV